MVRTIKSVLFSLLFFAILSSCEKEVSLENGLDPTGGTQSGTAIFTLDGAPQVCSTPLINGDYMVGTPLDLSNSVVISANVATAGTYTISTGLINGIQFTGSGTFGATGSQTITLFGTGTPVSAATSIFAPGLNGCSFIITATTSTVTPPTSVYTFAGAPASCTAPVISGSYISGTALNTSNTVAVKVDVTTAGTYSITTPTVNGINFTGSGTFANTGAGQVVTLKGNGTPAAAGSFSYTTSSTGCAFMINATSAGGTSVYTLNGAPNGCTAPVIAGTYTAGVPLGNGNTISVTANVTTAGTYSLTTNTVNGMTFAGSGTLSVGTSQPIILIGTGTPAAANTSSFNTGTGGCSFSVTAVAPPPASYTFAGAPGTCNPISVDGSYNTGNPLIPTSNTATVQVNVTVAGSYTITTNSVNGMTFSKTGVFASTGSQTVVLSGSGTPVTVGTNVFTVGTNGCSFSVTVTVPTSPCIGLVDGTFVMTGQFMLTGISFGTPFGSQFQATIQDISAGVQIDVFFPGGNPPPAGTYGIGSVTMHCLASDFTDWNAVSGSVYVSIDGFGNTSVEFCNITFHGTPIFGNTITATGAGKIVF